MTPGVDTSVDAADVGVCATIVHTRDKQFRLTRVIFRRFVAWFPGVERSLDAAHSECAPQKL